MTSSGIKPMTFWVAALHLNHLRMPPFMFGDLVRFLSINSDVYVDIVIKSVNPKNSIQVPEINYTKIAQKQVNCV
jgi:hypothetical protein